MRCLLALLFVVFLPGPASAHHGWGDYNVKTRLVLQGEVLAVEYGYPHVSVEFKDGPKVWHVILAPPSRMERRGLEKGQLKPGVAATVEGYPNRDKPEELRAERIIIDGKTIELR
jgi:hypothetical protein